MTRGRLAHDGPESKLILLGRDACCVAARQFRVVSRWLETRTTGPRTLRYESADYEQSLRRDIIAKPTSPILSNAIPSGSGVGTPGV